MTGDGAGRRDGRPACPPPICDADLAPLLLHLRPRFEKQGRGLLFCEMKLVGRLPGLVSASALSPCVCCGGECAHFDARFLILTKEVRPGVRGRSAPGSRFPGPCCLPRWPQGPASLSGDDRSAPRHLSLLKHLPYVPSSVPLFVTG